MQAYMNSLPVAELRRYKEKLELVGLACCPYDLPKCSWGNDPTKWPEVTYPDIVDYLVDSPGVYTTHTMKNHRSLEAHIFFTSGWVQPILHYQPQGLKHTIFKAKVKPSWRVTEAYHNAWVAVRLDGSIIVAHCDCTAGLGETCSHVGAVLFKMEASVRLGITAEACTSIACEWNNVSVKNVEPAQIKDIIIYSSEAKEKVKIKKKIMAPESTLEEQTLLLGLLATSGEKPVGLSSFAMYAHDFSQPDVTPVNPPPIILPPTLRSLFASESPMPHIPPVTEEQIALVEEETLDQASGDTWHLQRAGRITGSTAHSVLHTNPVKPANSVIVKICKLASTQLCNIYLQWGRKNEQHALQTYSFAQGLCSHTDQTSRKIYVSEDVKGHSNLRVEKAGFHICQKDPYLGVSCDGYVHCDCCGKGVLEVKCPYNWGQDTKLILKDWLLDHKGHLSSALSLKAKHSYYTQTQMQMFVCQTQYCDFVTWTPYMAIIFRIKRDDVFLTTALSKLKPFWEAHIYPELRTRSRETKVKGKASPVVKMNRFHNAMKRQHYPTNSKDEHQVQARDEEGLLSGEETDQYDDPIIFTHSVEMMDQATGFTDEGLHSVEMMDQASEIEALRQVNALK